MKFRTLLSPQRGARALWADGLGGDALAAMGMGWNGQQRSQRYLYLKDRRKFEKSPVSLVWQDCRRVVATPVGALPT